MVIGISTLDNPFPNDVGFNAPNFDIKIQNGAIPAGVRKLVQLIEYESSDGMADLMRITFKDPSLIPPKGLRSIGPLGGIGGFGGGEGKSLRDLKIIQPGNEISLWLGYGTQLKHIGRAIIRKIRPRYPREEVPTIEVIAYTKDSVMMDHAPEESKKKKGKQGRTFPKTTFADAVREKALDYNFTPDVDDTHDSPHSFIQKVGLTDYDFVNGLANLTGYYFWVDGDANGKWTLHFKDPEKLSRDVLQDKVYTFVYDRSNYSSLLEFEPELAIQGAITKLQVKVKDPKTGKVLEANFEEENDKSPDVIFEPDSDLLSSANKIEGKHSTASDIKIFIDDYSFEVKSNRRFKTEAELIFWAKQWFRRNRENFVLSSGTIIGVETIMARQIHKLSGLGGGLDGEYFFSNVTHRMDNESGYELECDFRKIVPTLA